MSKDSFTYTCPFSKTCKLHKKCHVITTVNKLDKPLVVKQICPAEGRNENGEKIEIEILIG